MSEFSSMTYNLKEKEREREIKSRDLLGSGGW
jgi:hypothetical protein